MNNWTSRVSWKISCLTRNQQKLTPWVTSTSTLLERKRKEVSKIVFNRDGFSILIWTELICVYKMQRQHLTYSQTLIHHHTEIKIDMSGKSYKCEYILCRSIAVFMRVKFHIQYWLGLVMVVWEVETRLVSSSLSLQINSGPMRDRQARNWPIREQSLS